VIAAILAAFAAAVGLLTTALMAGCTPPPVVRIVDGHEIHGRFIRASTYSLFLQGVIEESSGNYAAAERMYLAAHENDKQEPAILVRLGAVQCAWDSRGFDAAQRSFSAAIKVAPRYAPIFAERARCVIRNSNPDRTDLDSTKLANAESDARTAFALDPWDLSTTVLLAQVLELRGKHDEAATVLAAFAFAQPSPQAWMEVAAMAQRCNDSTRLRLASRFVSDRRITLDQLDSAIANENLDLAREVATIALVDQGFVAVRAAALGKWGIAREQARMVLAAEPGHPDALSAWLASPGPSEAFRSTDIHIWHRLLKSDEPTSRKLSDLGALVLADAIQRSIGPDVGRDIARSWLEARGVSSETWKDPIANSLLSRLGFRSAVSEQQQSTTPNRN